MQNILEKILKISKKTSFDFREFIYPDDELSDLFSQWIDYYKMKYSICKVIKPESILEIGVRYGYSAISFLKASPHARYLGIDNDSNTFGGSKGAFHWAKKITQGYKADFLISDTQKMVSLPDDFFELIHIDGQQDGDGTLHDLEMALEKGKYILVDGFFWSTENMLSSTYFMKKYNKFIEYSVIIPGYAGELLIKTRDIARNMFSDNSRKNSVLRNYYDIQYYLTDCGGYDTFSKTNGMELDERLRAVYTLTNPKKGEDILDIGCGRGELAFVLSQSEAKVAGLDYSKDAIEIARKTYSLYIGKNLEFIVSDILKYNSDRKFDKIIASDVVEHIEHDMLGKVLIKVSSLLKDNGYFIIHTAPNLLNYKYGYSKKRKQVKQAGSYIPVNPRSFYEDLMHINEFTPGRLNRVLKNSFADTLTWATNFPDVAGSLQGTFSKSDFINSSSIFSIASNRKINKDDVLASVTQPKLSKDDIFIDINVNISTSTLELNPTQVIKIPLTINNKGKGKVSSYKPYPVYLSYHWINEKGGMYIFDGIRTPLNMPVLPGIVLETYINVKAPEEPGKYVLQITMVQEGCFWFENHINSLPIKITTVVKKHIENVRNLGGAI